MKTITSLATTEEEERIIRERDDVAMILNDQLWPLWPILPVKNKGTDQEGLILTGHRTHVWMTNLFIRDPNAPVKQYPCIEALVADGWVVD